VLLIFITIHKKEDAQKIGRGLLEKRLIACYNLAPVESAYWWKGKIEEGSEVLMILKTNQNNFDKIETYIKKHSGYEVPEVVGIKPQKVNLPYLDWVNRETK